MVSSYSQKLVYCATNISNDLLKDIDFTKIIGTNYNIPLCGRYACHQDSPIKEYIKELATKKTLEFEEFRDCYMAACKMRPGDMAVILYNPNGEGVGYRQLLDAMGNRNIDVMVIVADGLPKTEEPITADTKKSEFLEDAERKFTNGTKSTSLFKNGNGEHFVDLARYNPTAYYI